MYLISWHKDTKKNKTIAEKEKKKLLLQQKRIIL